MKNEELREICQEQIGLAGEAAVVTLKQPGRWGKTDYRKLYGIKGEIVQDNFGDGMVVMYPAKELLSAIPVGPGGDGNKHPSDSRDKGS